MTSGAKATVSTPARPRDEQAKVDRAARGCDGADAGWRAADAGSHAAAAVRPALMSVIVCTANRAFALDCCLSQLTRIRSPLGDRLEIIVVDNNSSDDTPLVIEDHRCRSPIPLRHVRETRQGLAYARNAGIACAEGEVIAFTDDDCLVSPDWIENLWQEFSSAPVVDLVGGRVELRDPLDRKVTIKGTKHRQELVSIEQLDGFLHGCNHAFRRRVTEAIGLYDVRFGAGGTIPSAEDADFVYRAFRAGLKVVYSPRCIVYHDHGRRTLEQEQALRRIYRMGTGALRAKHALAGDRAMAVWTIKDYWHRAIAGASGWRAPREVIRQWRELGHYIMGAALYLRYRGLPTGTTPDGSSRRHPAVRPDTGSRSTRPWTRLLSPVWHRAPRDDEDR